MTFKDYLIKNNYYQITGYTKEEAKIRKYFGYGRETEINPAELDTFLNKKIVTKRSIKNGNTSWNEWIRFNENLLRANIKSKRNKIVRDCPNWLLEDILPLSKALERGIYKNNMINVFRNPNFKPKLITKTSYRKMLNKAEKNNTTNYI